MSHGLTNFYVEKLAKRLLKKKFKGVYPSDSHPNMKNFQFIIFNESKHYEKGTHYVCFAKFKKNVLYFDSLGKKLTNTSLKKFIYKNYSKYRLIKMFNNPIQSDNSYFCGFFCIAFLLCVKKKDFNFLYTLNQSNLPNNDKIVVDYLVNEIKKDL